MNHEHHFTTGVLDDESLQMWPCVCGMTPEEVLVMLGWVLTDREAPLNPSKQRAA